MSAHAAAAEPEFATIETRVPARLDRLPWARFHWMVVFGLGLVYVRARASARCSSGS